MGAFIALRYYFFVKIRFRVLMLWNCGGFMRSSVARSLKISIDIAKGGQQMHQLPMGPAAHGDIKPAHFLINR